MSRRKWRGTVLYVVILVVLGLTVGLRLYASGLRTVAAEAAAKTAQTAAAAPPSPSPSATVAPPSPAAVPAPAVVIKRIDGAVEQTPYGPIQVSVTFTGSRITAVKELQAPDTFDRSVQINNMAEPVLVREVLKSQSSRIDTVSGATYTSAGYAQSVQSAIDKL